MAFAKEQGWIAHGRSTVEEDYIAQFDLVVFALYPHVFLDWLRQYQGYFKPGALLTDVTGVKNGIVQEVQGMLRQDLEFIAAHPMAGRECSGVENAKKEIFYDANYIVVPTEKNTQQAIDTCRALGETLGFHTISTLTPERHDEMIGFLSQLTHCIAISLMTCRDTACLAEYSGDSFRDLTRIAKINETMWTELFLLNRDQLIEQMDLFERTFRHLRDCIADGRAEEIKEIMRQSTVQRGLFDKKESKVK
ncbi:MAG: prephenate dehydrogenase [Eubacteriales bacterium]|nr:prephenate dehydrogenase [Eubacteriales bacterium]